MTRHRTHRDNARRTTSIFEPLEQRQLMSAGDLDPTFGVGGKVIAQAVGFTVADVAVQNDGKVVAVGKLNNDFAVARLNANGTLDRSFGNGLVLTDFGGDHGDFANTVVIQPNGKILVAGRRDNQAETIFGDSGSMAVARYNSNGTLDNTFDGNGKLTVDIQGSGANALTLQSDGKILVAGFADEAGLGGNNFKFAAARLLPNGALDTTFGSFLTTFNGVAIRSGRNTIDFGGDFKDKANAVAVASDGKIVLGGIGGPGVGRFAVARLSSAGVLDKTFGDGISGDGKFNNLNLPDGTIRDLQVQPDGSVVAVGGVGNNFAVLRLTSAGRLDQNFAGNGHVETDFGGTDDAKHVRVSREGILVAGSTSGKFALARYRTDGSLDSTFGQGGKVTTSMVGNDAVLTTTLTSDGKIVAFGRSGSSARYISAVPTVNVFSLNPDTSEGGSQDGSLIFTRDIRASFPTRIFFDLGGSATLGDDYSGPVTQRTSTAGTTTSTGAFGTIAGGLNLIQIGGQIGFVDIPAGETIVVVPVHAIDDTRLESVETVVATIRANSTYSVGDRKTQTVNIADNEAAHINFQPAGAAPAGYVADVGQVFGNRGNGFSYGWDADNTGNARIRNNSASPDARFDTLIKMQDGVDRKWEIAVPNGLYTVHLVAGDPSFSDSVYRLNLENTLALEGTPSGAVHWFERTINVQVNDGRLTLSNAAGSLNNKITFIDIKSAAPGAVGGPVTNNQAISLSAAQPSNKVPTIGTRIFSEVRI